MDYRKFYDLESHLFNEVGPRFRESGSINPIDLYLIIIWKANRAKNKTKRRLAKLAGNFEQACQDISSGLASASSAKERLAHLMDKWRFQLPTATAILSVLYPEEFTVYDIRVCEVLGDFADLGNLKFSGKLWDRLQNYNTAVVNASPSALSLRECDKYLWGKSFYKQAVADCSRPEDDSRLVKVFEGGSVSTREEHGEYLLVVNQAAALDMLDPSDRDGLDAEYILRFKSAALREEYARQRGWLGAP